MDPILDELKITLDTYLDAERALFESLGADPALNEKRHAALKTFIRVLSERATNMAAQAALMLFQRSEGRLTALEQHLNASKDHNRS